VASSDSEQFEKDHLLVARIRRLCQRSNVFLFAERYTRELLAWAATGENQTGLDFLYYDEKNGPQVLRNTPEETEENISKAGDLIDRHGAIPIVVLEDTRITHPRMWNAESFGRGRVKMRQLAQTKRWPIVDIAALAGEPWNFDRTEYLVDFCHLHPRGHRIIGEMLADTLVRYIPPHEG
jgi:hypothetical protein